MSGEAIAVIGMSGAFPMARDLPSFWDNLLAGRDCISEVPAQRWDWRAVNGDPKLPQSRTQVRWGGFMEGIDEFDPPFFGISPREAALIDPQQRLLLTHAWNALEDAGYAPQTLAGCRVGVFIGTADTGYGARLTEAGVTIEGAQATAATVPSIGPNRLSYLLNFTGPSEPVETGCSSALVAVHRGISELRAGSCVLAIVGGINTLVSPMPQIALSKAGMLSPTGRCRAFSAAADGYVRGEGAGILVLKRLSQAEADGDCIHAVIRGTSVNHGGRGNSLTAPNARAQAALIEAAYVDAGTPVESVGYVEAHGSGTRLGDPIEIRGLVSAFNRMKGDPETASSPWCAVGSVKTNIGNLEMAAGVAGLIKAILQLEHATLLPSLHADPPSPHIQLEGTPFYVNKATRPWIQPVVAGEARVPRRSSVSSFGFGGVNAHVVLEEALPVISCEPARHSPPALVVLSARTDEALRERARALGEELKRRPDLDLTRVAYTLQVGRDAMEHRLALVVRTSSELQEALQAFAESGGDQTQHFHGVVQRTGNNLVELFADEDMEGLIGRWARAGCLEKLARWWVRGAEVPWQEVYSGPTPGRVHLPGYPFARQRLWAPPMKSALGVPPNVEPTLAPDLMLRRGGRVAFRFEVRPDDPFIADHRVLGARLLPAAASCAYAFNALRAIAPSRTFTLENLIWRAPVIADEAAVTLLMEIEGDLDALRLSLNELSADASERRVFEATARPMLEDDMPGMGIPEFAAPRTEAMTFYERLLARGLDYGERYRSVAWTQTEAKHVRGLVRNFQDGANRDPAEDLVRLLDGAFQCLTAHARADDARTMLPFSLARLSWSGDAPSAVAVHAIADEHAQYDISAESELGPTLRCVGFDARPAADPLDKLLYVPRWRRLTDVSDTGAISSSQPTAWVASSPDRLPQDLVRAGEPVFSIDEPAIAARWLAETDGAQLIIGDTLEATSDARPSAEIQLARLFRVLKACADEGVTARRRRVVIPSVQACDFGMDAVEADGAARLGLAGAFAKETPAWTVDLVDFAREDLQAGLTRTQFETAVAQCVSERSNPLVWRRGGAYVRRLTAISVDAVGPAFLRGGCYVIAGGAGGLGMALTEYLMTKYAAKVIWLGRRTVDDPEITHRLEDLSERIGQAPLYFQCDITDATAMNAASARIQPLMPQVNGLLHAAMDLRDRTLASMDEETLFATAGAKMAGAANMAKMASDLAPGWFCIFSSLQSVACAAGQSNYAAGSTFIDAFAAGLRTSLSCPTLVINWSAWGQVGAVAGDAYQQALAARGLRGLQTREGLLALERLIAAQAPQTFVVAASPEAARQLGLEAQPRERLQAPALTVRAPSLSTSKPTQTLLDELEQRRSVETLALDRIAWAVERLMRGSSDEPGEASDLAARGSVASEYVDLLTELLDCLVENGRLARADDRASSYLPSSLHAAPRGLAASDLVERHPNLADHVRLLLAATEGLPQVLRGERSATEILFPGGSFGLVEPVYRGGPVGAHVNTSVAEAVINLVRARLDAIAPHERVRILEVGAGTGGTTAFILETLTSAGLADRVEYVFTDLSQAFLLNARARFARFAGSFKTSVLDLEQAADRLPDLGQFDAVVAANVIHVTRNIERALRGIKMLLRRGGWLIASELVQKRPFLTATFGLLAGWRNYDDPERRISGSPCLTTNDWRLMLRLCGFGHGLVPLATVGEAAGQQVIIGISDGFTTTPSRFSSDAWPSGGSPAAAGAGQDSVDDASLTSPRVQASAAPAVNATPVIRAVPTTRPTPVTRGMPPVESDLTGLVAELVRETLKLKTPVDPDVALLDLGVDSIVSVELIRAANDRLGCDLTPLVVYDHPTVRRLAAHIAKTIRPAGRPGPAIGKAEELARRVSGGLSIEAALDELSLATPMRA